MDRNDETGRGGCGGTVHGCLFLAILVMIAAIAIVSVVVRR